MISFKYVRDIADRLGLRWLRAHKPDLSSVRSRLHRPTLSRWQVGVLLGFGALVFLFVVFVAVDGGLYYNKTHHGIRVAGQDLGGLSRDKATAALTTLVYRTRRQLIILTSGDNSWQVLPGDVGTTIDVAASVSAAKGLTRNGNVFSDLGRRIELYFSDRELPLRGTVDDRKLTALVDEVAAELDRQPHNARMVMGDGRITIAAEEPGIAVDKQALREQLTAHLLRLDSIELLVPTTAIEPDVSAADISSALEGARTIISSDLVLTHGERTWTLTPEDLGPFLDLTRTTVDGVSTLVPSLSATAMGSFLDDVADSVDKPAVDATMDSDGKTVWVVPAADGQVLDREKTAAALTQAALWVAGRTAEVALAVAKPKVTTGEVEAMGIRDLLASYATKPYRGSSNRQNNVRLGTRLCSGILLAPGEEFDTDKQLGKRNKAHGWRVAPGIVGDGEMKYVYGGGICQVSTTLFNAVFEAGLEVLERHNHSVYINHYPPGRDATVSGGGKNLRFRNDTDHYVFIWGSSTGVVTKFYIWGVSDGRTVTSRFSGSRRWRCTVTRTVTWPDGTTKTEKFASHYTY